MASLLPAALISVTPCSLVLAAARWRTFAIAAAVTRVGGIAFVRAAPRAIAADVPACAVALPFGSVLVFLGAIGRRRKSWRRGKRRALGEDWGRLGECAEA